MQISVQTQLYVCLTLLAFLQTGYEVNYLTANNNICNYYYLLFITTTVVLLLLLLGYVLLLALLLLDIDSEKTVVGVIAYRCQP